MKEILFVIFVICSYGCNGQNSCFEVGKDYPLNDIQSFGTETANDCQAACAVWGNCQFFSFSPSSKTCWLKTSLGTSTLNLDRVSGPKYCSDSCFEVGNDYPLNDLQSFSTQTAKDCQAICSVWANCLFFVFGPSSKTCWLKRSIGSLTTVVRNLDRVSGPKYCSDSCYEVGIDYPLNDIQSMSTNTAKDCQAACAGMAKCQLFAFSTSQKKCLLKSSIGTPIRNLDRVTGKKYCSERLCPPGWGEEDSFCWRYTIAGPVQNALFDCIGTNDQDTAVKSGPTMIRLGQLRKLLQNPSILLKLVQMKFKLDAKRSNGLWVEISTGSTINLSNYPEFSTQINALAPSEGDVLTADISALVVTSINLSKVVISTVTSQSSGLPSICMKKKFGAKLCNGDPFATECHDRGNCINGYCKCFPGFAGQSCQLNGKQCPGNDCGQFGSCNYNTGTCVCPVFMNLTSAGDSCVPPKINCGVSKTSRIVGGSNVSVPHSIPWVVMVIDSRNFALCGGTVIDFLHVLTAAECTVGKKPRDLFIVHSAHDFNLASTTDGKISQGVSEILNHPGYDPSNSNNNFAILRLTIPITFSVNVTPACLPKDNTMDFSGYPGVTSGWGTTNESDSAAVSETLKSVQLNVITNDECYNNYKLAIPPQAVTPQMLCAGATTPGMDSCDGDTGGPLTVRLNNVNYLVGVVSHGLGCGRPGFPGVYSRVSTALDWIRSNTFANLCPAP